MLLREIVPQILWDAWRTKFEQVHQGTMKVSEYAIRFSGLSHHALALVSTVRDQVRRFIDGLNYDLRFSIARGLEIDTPFQLVVEIAHRLERMRGQDREDREAKMPRDSRGFSGARAPIVARHGRGYVSRPVHSALPSTRSALATHYA
ncbi:uncharacterized protein [Nicotiana tomentosiformis]|uniref:uncharacterized protein n=1 Tax=Nicotiana tomentosiformis TaxID=4098 RepID=UPI00388CEBF8